MSATDSPPEDANDDDSRIERWRLRDLHPDVRNPRFGGRTHATGREAERETLSAIITTYGVRDVLASLATNEYFESEPLLCVRDGSGGLIVREGNRRLAACLLLARDPRVSDHTSTTAAYADDIERMGWTPDKKIPVIVFDTEREQDRLLPYLGVKHIAASQPWDSWAKASWVARVVSEQDLSVAQIARSIGDQHGTVKRILEGYYVAKQVEDHGSYSMAASMRRGRGSNPEFPFSWLYTALGYGSIRDWIGLPDRNEDTEPDPAADVERASDLFRFMFGDEDAGREPVVPDSRDIAELAQCIAKPDLVRELRSGTPVTKAAAAARPIDERLRQALRDADDALAVGLRAFTSGRDELDRGDVRALFSMSRGVVRASRDLALKLKGVVDEIEENELGDEFDDG